MYSLVVSTERVVTASYTVTDLARLAGVAVRTVRYYLAQGLLPASGESGPGAHYGAGHLDRLLVIRRLQGQHLPLAEIRRRIGGLRDEEIAAAVAAPEPAAPASSALEYVRGVLGTAGVPTAAQPSLSRRVAVPEPPTGALDRTASAGPEPARPPAQLERSQWDRISLGSNLELNVRRPLSRIEQRRVERLITIARQVLKEDMP